MPKAKRLDAGARETCRALRQQLFLSTQQMKIDRVNAGDLPRPASGFFPIQKPKENDTGARGTCRTLRQQLFINSKIQKYFDAGARVTCRTLQQQLFLTIQKMENNSFNAGARVTCRALRQQLSINSETERKWF